MVGLVSTGRDVLPALTTENVLEPLVVLEGTAEVAQLALSTALARREPLEEFLFT